jgi:SAM-dependent methyltransferase
MAEQKDAEVNISQICVCPKCRSDLDCSSGVRCSDLDCKYSRDGFPLSHGQPVLIDFDQSIFNRANYTEGNTGSFIERDDTGKSLKLRFRRLVTGRNEVAEAKIRDLLSLLKAHAQRPTILVVGGGAIGSGVNDLYRQSDVIVIGTDVYASENTMLVCDGHRQPFKDETFDAVWIQAVLEHVLQPQVVVDEIYRVLRPDGLVYADTPFMQQVHEGAYDFTRFTQSGHRWLFRHFDQIEAGPAGGAGVALIWSVRYFVRSLGFGNKVATVAALPFFWLRFLGPRSKRRFNADAASGTYFFGRKSDEVLSPKDMVSYYESQK